MADYKVVLGDTALDISEKFYNNLKSTVKVEKENKGTTIDLGWIDNIKDAAPYIDNIFNNPKRFIINEEEILKVEKSKKVTVDSIKHLTKHTNFISEYDEEADEVTPSKLLNVLKEDTFNTYENRFIYTLVDFIDSFLNFMKEKMADLDYVKTNDFYYNGDAVVSGEHIICKVQIDSTQAINANSLDSEEQQKMDAIRAYVNSWKQSQVYKSLRKAKVAKVTNPIKRTNVILKNPNFQQAMKLWDFLYNYSFNDVSDNNNHQVVTDIPNELRRLTENTFLINYLVMKLVNSKGTSQSEYKKYYRKVALRIFGDATKLLADADEGITEKDMQDIVKDNYNASKVIKEADKSEVENQIKDSIKNYLERIEKSYFEIGGNDEKEDI